MVEVAPKGGGQVEASAVVIPGIEQFRSMAQGTPATSFSADHAKSLASQQIVKAEGFDSNVPQQDTGGRS